MMGRNTPPFLGYINTISTSFSVVMVLLKMIVYIQRIKTSQTNVEFLNYTASVSNFTFTNNSHPNGQYPNIFSCNTPRVLDFVASEVKLYSDSNDMKGDCTRFNAAIILCDSIQTEKFSSNKIVGVLIYSRPELIFVHSPHLHHDLGDANSLQNVIDQTLTALPETTPNALFFINAQCAIDYNNALLGVEKIDHGSHDEL